MKMAAVQMVSGTSVEGNLLQAGQLLEQAAAPGRRTGRAARVLLSHGLAGHRQTEGSGTVWHATTGSTCSALTMDRTSTMNPASWSGVRSLRHLTWRPLMATPAASA